MLLVKTPTAAKKGIMTINVVTINVTMFHHELRQSNNSNQTRPVFYLAKLTALFSLITVTLT